MYILVAREPVGLQMSGKTGGGARVEHAIYIPVRSVAGVAWWVLDYWQRREFWHTADLGWSLGKGVW